MLALLAFLFYLLAAFSFSFALWRRLRDDYTNEKIFSWTLRVLALSLLGVWIAQAFIPQFVFFSLFLFGTLSGIVFLKTLGLKFFELIDAVAISIFYFVFFSWIGLGISEGRNLLLLDSYTTSQFYPHLLIALFSIYLYLIFRKYYRGFLWYPSGKVGFCGLASLGIFFLLNAGVEVTVHFKDADTLYKIYSFTITTQMVNAIIGLGLFIALFVVIYLRSGIRRR